MRYLSGTPAGIAAELADGTLGLLRSPRSRDRLDRVAVWGMDNGCFTGAYPGDVQYLGLLGRLRRHQPRCLFVTVPDVVGNATATLARFNGMAVAIRTRGWPVALVAQDGLTPDMIPWHRTDWLFIGGSTRWKMSSAAADLITVAKDQGRSVHVGRVNSKRRFDHFDALGADSVDGTYLAFGPDRRRPQLLGWLNDTRKATTGCATL